jgi:hypothetical protein
MSGKRSTLSTGLAGYVPAKGGAANIPTGETAKPAAEAPAPAPAADEPRAVGRPSVRQAGGFKTLSVRISNDAWNSLWDLTAKEHRARTIHDMLLTAIDDFLEGHGYKRNSGVYKPAKGRKAK